MANNGDAASTEMRALVAKTTNNDVFWDEIENNVRITKPLFLLIKFCDGEGPKMREVHDRMIICWKLLKTS